jgi:DNA transformation protein
MAFSAEFRQHIEETLSEVMPIRTKAMFGGVGIYCEDLIFALIAEDKLYFKVSDLNRSDYEAAGMGPFYPYDSPTPMGYWEVPQSVLTNKKELTVWIDKAVEVAVQAKRPKKKGPTRKA